MNAFEDFKNSDSYPMVTVLQSDGSVEIVDLDEEENTDDED